MLLLLVISFCNVLCGRMHTQWMLTACCDILKFGFLSCSTAVSDRTFTLYDSVSEPLIQQYVEMGSGLVKWSFYDPVTFRIYKIDTNGWQWKWSFPVRSSTGWGHSMSVNIMGIICMNYSPSDLSHAGMVGLVFHIRAWGKGSSVHLLEGCCSC